MVYVRFQLLDRGERRCDSARDGAARDGAARDGADNAKPTLSRP
jgi:hypothetical protein